MDGSLRIHMGLSEQRQINHFAKKMRPVVPSPYENHALWFIIIRTQCYVSMLLSTECTQWRCDVDGRTQTHMDNSMVHHRTVCPKYSLLA